MNPADICRECEITSKTRELEEENRALKMELDTIRKQRDTYQNDRLHYKQKAFEFKGHYGWALEEISALRQAGDSMEHCLGLIIKNYAENIITRDSIIAWHKAKEEAE